MHLNDILIEKELTNTTTPVKKCALSLFEIHIKLITFTFPKDG